MECELRSIRQAAQSQERTIQGLTETISTKDGEVFAHLSLCRTVNNRGTEMCYARCYPLLRMC